MGAQYDVFLSPLILQINMLDHNIVGDGRKGSPKVNVPGLFPNGPGLFRARSPISLALSGHTGLRKQAADGRGQQLYIYIIVQDGNAEYEEIVFTK
jgi:hypothetical protein